MLNNLGPQAKFQTKTKGGTVLHSNIPLSNSSKKVKGIENHEEENPNSVKKVSVNQISSNSSSGENQSSR
jgi:hypothetical protein